MASALDFIRTSQDATGGWGYFPGHYPTTEATAAVILALRENSEASDLIERGLQWLRATQHADGGWGYVADDEESGWQTAWAVLVFSQMKIVDDVYRKGVNWLIDVKPLGNRGDDFSKYDEMIDPNDAIVHSWPWYPGELGWVEPTSLAILALEKETSDQVIATRIEQARKYIQQRRCPGGGWNVGNPVMFEQALPARAPQTAVALIALLASGSIPKDENDIGAMRRDMLDDGSPLALAWGSLALKILGFDHTDMIARLHSLQQENGSWSKNNYHTGIALMAERGTI